MKPTHVALILLGSSLVSCMSGALVSIALRPEPQVIERVVEAPPRSLPGVPASAPSQQPLPTAAALDGRSMADVTERVVPAVVNVAAFTARGRGAPDSVGSGVVVRADGLVVTNNHVVAHAVALRVALADGRVFPARIVGLDEDSDMALLSLEGASDLPTVAYGDSSDLRQGDVVLAVGNPFGVGQTVTMGIVSAVGRASVGITELEDFIQTDAAINPGNSGGALISMRGELVGINTAILSRTGGSHGIGFAIPSNMVEAIVENLLAHGHVVRGWLGVGPQDLTPDLVTALGLPAGQQGVLVTSVEEGSPAAQAGLQRGDVIESLDGERLRSRSQLRTVVATRGASAQIGMVVVRGSERRELQLVLAERPMPLRSPRPFGVDPGQPYGPYGAPPDPSVPALRPSVVVAGAQLVDLDPRVRQALRLPASLEGVLVSGVAPGSLADLAGLRPGSVILEANRTPLESASQLARLYAQAGGGITILVRQGGMDVYTVLR